MSQRRRRVLIAGASFAGLSCAYWMHKLGYEVTVIERAASLKTGGTPVDIRHNTVAILKRMGLCERVMSLSLPVKSTEFANDDGTTVGNGYAQELSDKREGFEIERDTLLAIIFDAIKSNVEVIFADSICSLEEGNNCIEASLNSGAHRQFDMVFGCDGVRSDLRHLCFGPESQYAHFLGAYGSVSILDKMLVPENTAQFYNEHDRMISVGSYNGKTDIILIFSSEHEIAYDHRDKQAKKSIMVNAFSGMGWRTSEFLKEVESADYFYFDKLSQIKMPMWTKGRVALVGDAAYCASPAAGRGGSLAIDGAAALADALGRHGSNFEAAFAEYNRSFRPVIEEVQAGAEDALKLLVPETAATLRRRKKRNSYRFKTPVGRT